MGLWNQRPLFPGVSQRQRKYLCPIRNYLYKCYTENYLFKQKQAKQVSLRLWKKEVLACNFIISAISCF